MIDEEGTDLLLRFRRGANGDFALVGHLSLVIWEFEVRRMIPQCGE